VLRKKLAILLAAAMMTVMVLASAGVASAFPGNRGQGAAHANPTNAAFGIATAINHANPCC
jgi:hypothetical protein